MQSFAGVQIWGYGEEMISHGLDSFQLPSLRCQTMGHRSVVMVALDKLASYLKVCRKGEAPNYKDMLQFVQTAQPSSLAAFLSAHPDGLCHVLLTKQMMAYLPPGWMLQEKAGASPETVMSALMPC